VLGREIRKESKTAAAFISVGRLDALGMKGDLGGGRAGRGGTNGVHGLRPAGPDWGEKKPRADGPGKCKSLKAVGNKCRAGLAWNPGGKRIYAPCWYREMSRSKKKVRDVALWNEVQGGGVTLENAGKLRGCLWEKTRREVAKATAKEGTNAKGQSNRGL